MEIGMLQTLMCSPGIGGRRGLRPLFWGPPGIGKTALAESLVSAMGGNIITIIASLREPADFLGIPMPSADGKSLFYAAPDWAVKANLIADPKGDGSGDGGQLVVVFVDELTTCAPAVQNAMLRVVNEGQVGELTLHPNVVFIAAANPPDQAAAGYELSPPMANRWVHLDWHPPSANEWSEGILSDWAGTEGAMTAAAAVKLIDQGYDVHHAKAKGLITGFLQRNSLLFKLPEEGDPSRSRAWCSPRSWDNCIRVIAGANSYGLKETQIDKLIQGTVGKAAAVELLTYKKKANLPDPAKLLDAKDPNKVWKLNPKRPDITAAVFNSCAALVTPKKAAKRDKRAAAMWNLVNGSLKTAGDVSVMAARSLAKAGLTKTPEARAAIGNMGHIMKAMGEIG